MSHVASQHDIDINCIVAEPNHTATTDSGQSSILKRFDFEHDANIRRQTKTFTVRQSEQFVVVQDTVQVLNPLRIDITIEDDPVTLAVFTTQVVDNLAENAREQTIGPLTGSAVEAAVKAFLGHDLRVNDMADTLDAIDSLQSSQKGSPSVGFTRTRATNHHDTVMQVLNLIELQDLCHPSIGCNQVALLDHFVERFTKSLQRCRNVLNAREHFAFDLFEELCILAHKLRRDSFPDTLDNDLRLHACTVGCVISILDSRSLEPTRAHEHALQGSQTKVVMGLLG